MSITLNGIALPDEMIWSDEFEWSPVDITNENTIGGKLILSESSVTGEQGRPITLVGDNAWAQKTNMLLIHALAQALGSTMTLILHDASSRNVKFRHWDKPAFSARKVSESAFSDEFTWYNLQAKLVVV